MLSQANNDLLTLVEGDAPMGRVLRQWAWTPFALPSQLRPYEAPLKVRLLGEDYVAWRTPDGAIGFIDQACPHRRASMALARNEGCALRCIFHGWTVHADGYVAEAPSHHGDAEKFAASVKVKHYPTFEGGDMVWVYLGDGDPPPRPNLPMFQCGEGQVYTVLTKAYCNWFQGVEGSIDTAHLTSLHTSWIPTLSPKGKSEEGQKGDKDVIMQAEAPIYEIQRRPWGLTAVGLRKTPKGKLHMRASQYVAPYLTLIPSYPHHTGTFFAIVPVDNTHHLLFSGAFSFKDQVDENWPLIRSMVGNGRLVKENFAPLGGGVDENFGQDREAMANGHFSGFPNNLLEEDMVVQASMGPITDRSKEHLSSSDTALVQARMLMLKALRNDAEGQHPLSPRNADYGFEEAMPVDAMIPIDENWADVLEAVPAKLRETTGAASAGA